MVRVTDGTRQAQLSPAVFWCVVGPAAVWLAAAAAVLVASFAGFPALAVPADLTLSEAAAIRDEAEVLRRIRAGEDPNAVRTVRRGIVSDAEFLLTPLEAATAARHGDVVRLLVRNGAGVTERNFPLLYCLATRNGAPDIAELLQEHAPPGSAAACEAVRLPL